MIQETEDVWRRNFLHPGEWDHPFPPVSMVTLFEDSARAHPQAPLLDFFGRKYSYGETMGGAARVEIGREVRPARPRRGPLAELELADVVERRIDDLLAELGGGLTGTPLDWLALDRLPLAGTWLDLGVATRSPLRSPIHRGAR